MEEENKSENKPKEMTETQKKSAFVILAILLPMMITESIYLIVALSVDPLKYPTILMIANIIIGFAFFKNKTREVKKRTFKGTVTQLLVLVYFIYMFKILVF